MKEFVEEDDDQGGDDELEDEEETDTGSEIGRLSVETSENVNGGLSEGDEESQDWTFTQRRLSLGRSHEASSDDGTYASEHLQTRPCPPSK